MTHLAERERRALCETFLSVGPEAPTLCSPWTTADLAAHLVIRERRPDLAPGIWVSALASRTDAGMDQYAARPWPELVSLVRSGPPVWSPARVPAVDNAVNFAELFIHHEDVLRGDESVGPRREVDAWTSKSLWKLLRRSGRIYFRRSPVGVDLTLPTGEAVTVRSATELGTVVLTGTPAELTLVASGRRRVADFEADGSPEAIAALWDASLGLA